MMSETAEQLKPTLAALSNEDRAELARFLLESLDPEMDPDVEASWVTELNRRVSEIQSGNAVGIPMEEVLRRMREKYP
jgi:putative addiction module component (TIGR02574 family)